MLLAVVGISVSAMADGTLTCTVYGSNGAVAELTNKGDCTNDSHSVLVHVKVKNMQDDQRVKVAVDIYEAQTGKYVTSIQIYVGDSGWNSATVEGLEPGRCYTFSLSNAVTCE